MRYARTATSSPSGGPSSTRPAKPRGPPQYPPAPRHRRPPRRSSTATPSLVHLLCRSIIPPVETATGTVVRVSGSTAANIDISAKIAHALPLFMAMVIGLTMLLLLVVFRSIFVPVKAAVAILLSIGGAFGVIVAVFQWGWFKGVIGLQETQPIIS